MFQPNGLRALRELKLDKELEKTSMQFSQNNSQIKTKKSRSISNTENLTGQNNDDTSDFSEDDQDYIDSNRPQTTSGNPDPTQPRGMMSNNSEYFQKMKSLLEKNPYHPMNFIFDHKDLLKELNQFIEETRNWRETQKKELEEQLQLNKQRAITSVEENEELQNKIKEQQEFEEYLKKVQSIQEEYNIDINNYQKFIQTNQNKENNPSTNNTNNNKNNNSNKDLNQLIEDSKKKVSQMGNLDEYLQKAQIEVEYNKLKLNDQNNINNDINNEDKYNQDMNDHLIQDISDWEKQVDYLLLNLNDKPSDITQTSKQRVQSARQNQKQDYNSYKDDDLEKEMEELDKEFQELEDMLESVKTTDKK